MQALLYDQLLYFRIFNIVFMIFFYFLVNSRLTFERECEDPSMYLLAVSI
jgi:hypothetical protein